MFGREEVIRSCTPNYLTDAILRRENLDRYDDRLMVTINLIDAYDQLIEFIKKHTLDKFFLIGDQSVSVHSKIARELVNNNLAHREYTSAFPAKIIVEQDRIVTENWSIPRNPGRIDPNRFTPYSKNPLLANFFVQIGRADTLGSGVRNLYEFTKIYSGGEPELIYGDVFRTIVSLGESSRSGANGTDSGANGTKLGADSKAVLIEALRQNPNLTYDETSKQLSLPRRTVSRELNALQEEGKIRRVGNNRTGRWEIISVD